MLPQPWLEGLCRGSALSGMLCTGASAAMVWEAWDAHAVTPLLPETLLSIRPHDRKGFGVNQCLHFFHPLRS